MKYIVYKTTNIVNNKRINLVKDIVWPLLVI